MNHSNHQLRALTSAIAVVINLGALFSTTPALAQSPWYAGGSVGRSQTQYGSGVLANDLAIRGITVGGSTVDNAGVGFKLFAGYQLSESFAVEGGYVNLGTFDVRGNYTRPLPAGTFTGDIKPQGVNVDLLGKFDLGNALSIYMRGGGAYLSTKASASATTAGFIGYSNATKDQVVASIGAGLQMDFSKSFGARLEWQHFFQVGDSTTGRADIDLLTIGLIRRF